MQALCGQCGFISANMYARSIFGENALANLSIEKPFNKPDAPVTGHIRIRAKSQVSNGLCNLLWLVLLFDIRRSCTAQLV